MTLDGVKSAATACDDPAISIVDKAGMTAAVDVLARSRSCLPLDLHLICPRTVTVVRRQPSATPAPP